MALSELVDTFMSYSFAQLLPERMKGAAMHNAALLGELSYGIEVTEPGLAARCGLGNLDPQHTCGATMKVRTPRQSG
jgi:hypothetical protein